MQNNNDQYFVDIEKFCSKTFKSIDEIAKEFSHVDDLKNILDAMVEEGIVKLKLPTQKESPKQQYKKTEQIKQTSQTARVLELIKRFSRGDKICIEVLQEDALNASENNLDSLWLNESTNKPMSEKSIRRDLDIIKHHFPQAFELIRGEKGCYKALTNSIFSEFLKPETLSLLIQTFNIAQRNSMFDSFKINETDKKLIKQKVKDKDSVYLFKNRPFETKESDIELFNTLEHNIKFSKKILLEYKTNREEVKTIEVKPYKIIFMNENFYLAGEVDGKYPYQEYRISRITSIKELGSKFTKNHEIVEFIDDIQTPFSQYSQGYKAKLIDVIVEVSKKKANFFRTKQYMPSQKVSENSDGSLEVTFKVTTILEMNDLIKRWIPHVKVLEPIELKESIDKELKEYLKL